MASYNIAIMNRHFRQDAAEENQEANVNFRGLFLTALLDEIDRVTGNQQALKMVLELREKDFIVIQDEILHIPLYIERTLGLPPRTVQCIPDTKIIIELAAREVRKWLEEKLKKLGPNPSRTK